MLLLPKKIILFPVLVAVVFISCKKNSSPPASPQPRVKSARDDRSTTNYTYDAKWRLIKYDYRSIADSNLKEYVYTDTAVTVKNYTGNGIYQGTSVYRLNAKGLAISMTDPASFTSHTYTYNSNNQVIRLEVMRTPPGNTYYWDNKYYYNSNGDLDSSTVMANTTGVIVATYYPEYDMTNTTTLDNENHGLSFLGTTIKHPLKKTTTRDGISLYTYNYAYDSRGRVAKQDISIGGVAYISYSFTYY